MNAKLNLSFTEQIERIERSNKLLMFKQAELLLVLLDEQNYDDMRKFLKDIMEVNKTD